MTRFAAAAFTVLVLAVQGCASAAESISPERLSVSAQGAELEARTVAATWADTTALVYIEGEGVRPSGRVFPDAGQWRFVYASPDRAEQLVVAVAPTSVEQVTRPPQGPPGFVLGDARLGDAWIDSSEALDAVAAAGGEAVLRAEGASISMLLVPARPPRWVVRASVGGDVHRWQVDARTGEVME